MHSVSIAQPSADRHRLDGRRVIVTGGVSGIGRAAVLAIARRGAAVLAVDINDAAGEQIASSDQRGGGIWYQHADVSREAEAERAVETAIATLGGIDVLIHAAGIMAGQLQEIQDHDEATWDRVIDVNLKGAFLVTKHVAPLMVSAGRGVVILLASKAGVVTGSGSYSYGASKGGVHGLALTLDRHLGPRGIRVNDVCPGDVDTPLMRGSLAEAVARGGDPATIEGIAEHLTSPDAIADLLAFLASDAAGCVRGTIYTS